MVPRFTTGVTAKVLGVAGLALSMLIPLAQVNDLIGERAGRAQEAARQIAVRWGAPQVVGGPYEYGIPGARHAILDGTGAGVREPEKVGAH